MSHKLNEQFLLPRPPRPAAKLTDWVLKNGDEVVSTIKSLFREQNGHLCNEQVTLSLLEDSAFKVELCVALRRYNDDVVVKRWDKISKDHPEMVKEFFPKGFEDFLEAARCDYMDIEVQKSHTQLVVLRLREEIGPDILKSEDPVDLWVFEEAPSLESPRHMPRVTRRLQRSVITPEMIRSSQTMSNVPFAWNKYSEKILEAVTNSPLVEEDKWKSWFKRASSELAAVRSWNQFFVVWCRWEWRMRAMVTTKDRLNPQGNKISQSLFRFAEAVEVRDEDLPSVYYVLTKYGISDDNYLEIIKSGITCKGDIKRYSHAVALLEIKETGKSSHLWGLDQVASLMRLTCAYMGDARGFRHVGLHLKGMPWDGIVTPDVWAPVSRDTISGDPDVSPFYDPSNPVDLKLARAIAKLVGTRHGFGARELTAAYGLLGLDRDRDESRIELYEKLDDVLSHIEWPKLYEHIVDQNWVPEEHLALAKSKCELVIGSIDKHYPWLAENTKMVKNLMRNRWYHGKDARPKPYPLPHIEGPFGFVLDPQPWRRSKTKVDRIKSSFKGVSIEGQMYRTKYDPLPDLGTMWIHFVESIETLKTNLSFTAEVSPRFLSIFDNYLTDAQGLKHLPEHHTRAFKETMQHFESAGWPLEMFAGEMGMVLPTRNVSSSDVNLNSCFLSA